MINSRLLSKVQKSGKQILLVTKYWGPERTSELFEAAYSQFGDSIYGIGENRIEQIREKNIPRSNMHFIGNIQSQKIPEIVKYCSHIHSLASLKHAKKIENQDLLVQAFIQIKLDPNKNIGISEEELGDFLKSCEDFKNLRIIGISGMGSGDVSEGAKKQEFKKLISLRNTHIPKGLISAGTSRDYEIALKEGIDIVRIGQSLIK